MKVMKKMDSCAANEISLLSKIHHENIVRYFEHFDQVIDALDYTCIITEHCQVCIKTIDILLSDY